MEKELMKKYENAIWIGKSLFERERATGSSANMSFIHKGDIYITGTGTCFGRLTIEDFAVVDKNGRHISGANPSKEISLHRSLYLKHRDIEAVIHTHSHYSTLWSCIEHTDKDNVVPEYTPYLKMKIGDIGLIPYGKPGTKELFDTFDENLSENRGYLLKNHGPIVGHKDIMGAFYCLEELEDSIRIAWELRGEVNQKQYRIK